jgi:hypothetical protein
MMVLVRATMTRVLDTLCIVGCNVPQIRRAAVASVRKGEQVVGMDIQSVPVQDGRRDTFASAHAAKGTAVANVGDSGRGGYRFSCPAGVGYFHVVSCCRIKEGRRHVCFYYLAP